MINVEKTKAEMFDIVGALYEVHNELGPGLSEYCYQEGLKMELEERHIQAVKEYSFHPTYHSKKMNASYRVDFLCKKSIIVECKAVVGLNSEFRAQLFNYMRLLNMPGGILVNFYQKEIHLERYFFDVQSREILSYDNRPLFRQR
jgi:GxxExxY protein